MKWCCLLSSGSSVDANAAATAACTELQMQPSGTYALLQSWLQRMLRAMPLCTTHLEDLGDVADVKAVV